MSTLSPSIERLWRDGESFKEPLVPKPFQYLDLTLGSSGTFQRKRDKLAEDEVHNWVHEVGDFKRPDEDKGGFRLLVASAMDGKRHNLKPWCFSLQTARLVFEKFDLMDEFFHACKTGNRVMSFRPPPPGSQGKLSWVLRQTHHAAAVSYCMRTNRVCGVVLAGSDGQQDFVQVQDSFLSKVLEMKELACHPMLLPYVVLSNETDRLDTERCADNTKVFDFETTKGLRGNRFKDEEFTEEMTKAMQKIGKDLIMIINHRADAEILEKNFKDAIAQGITDLEEEMQSRRQSQAEDVDDEGALMLRDGSITDRMQRHSRDLKRRIKYLFDCNRSVAASFKALQKRAQVQMDGLYMIYTNQDSKLNLQMAKDSRRLASASQRDSSSMKVIAVITTLFLPATFIATVFGMNMIDLQFWVYLAISIPLTLLVMILVSAWMYAIKKQNRYTDAKAEKQMENPTTADIVREYTGKWQNRIRTWA